MKKLIMFLMVLAISVPALALIDDVAPEWGDENPISTAVWQLDKNVDYFYEEGETVEPSCLQGTVDSHFATFDFNSSGWSWGGGILTSEGNGLSAMVGVPEGEGNAITCQVTVRFAGGDGPDDMSEPAIEIWNGIRETDEFEWLGEYGSEFVDEGDGYYTQTATISGGDYSEDITHIGAVYRGAYGMMGIIIDAVIHEGADPPEGEGRSPCIYSGLPNPIIIDPNVMLVYETDETEGNFGVSLLNEPPAEATIAVTVDPNTGGPSEDITLIGGSGDLGSVTFIFDANNYDVPQIIRFKAIDDDIPEPPELLESQYILVTSSWPGHESDANYVGEKIVTVEVMDNDQANIMFTYSPFFTTGGGPTPETPVLVDTPIQIWEQLSYSWSVGSIRKRNIGMKLQVKPSGDPVKLNAEVTEVEEEPGGDNLPLTDPCLPIAETDDPNCFTFTSTTSTNETGLKGDCPDWDTGTKTSCWDVEQDITIWGNDDAELQVTGEEGEYPSSAGDQNYQAILEVTVIDDGGDDRYADMVKQVDIDIEDNECGAFGIVPMDVSNGFYMTDPNYGEGDPECHVDLYDVIAFTIQWFDCSDPQDDNCVSYL